MPGPRSGMKPIRDGSECGGIVHAADATFIPQASERPNVILSAILSTNVYKSLFDPLDAPGHAASPPTISQITTRDAAFACLAAAMGIDLSSVTRRAPCSTASASR